MCVSVGETCRIDAPGRRTRLPTPSGEAPAALVDGSFCMLDIPLIMPVVCRVLAQLVRSENPRNRWLPPVFHADFMV